MVELREEIGMKKHLRMKEVVRRLRWTDHIQRLWWGSVTEGDLVAE